ncbi:hypothetical protein PCAR4_250013 [Paraburkholderia caribensis]|nr:hypothetical protein PCAR4_250013 [Paraburkholderia caribensis]
MQTTVNRRHFLFVFCSHYYLSVGGDFYFYSETIPVNCVSSTDSYFL